MLPKAKTSKQIAGDIGEKSAKDYLIRKGLKFISANWRCKLGEVDLVMKEPSPPARRARQSDGCLVFVEVRTRRATSYGEGLDTVAAQKQRKLINTARYYQQKEDYWGDIRFDVVSVTIEENTVVAIEHIPDAFMLN